MKRWGEKRYHSLDWYLKETYGEKLYKITLNGGFTCPNRDGTVGIGGCIFCSGQGSGDFAGRPEDTITEQLTAGREALRGKRPVKSYIAYFQAFTNTYAPVEKLKTLYGQALRDPDVRLISIATRPDCLGDDVLALLARIQEQKPVWVELGLQTIHEDTARYIRRGYPLSVFEEAVAKLRRLDIPVIVHTILFLPGETKEQMFQTIQYLNNMGIQGIKLQLLHILKGTDLALAYERAPFHVPDMEEYLEVLTGCIARLNPEIVIHRLTGDGPKELLIAPQWTKAKRTVLNRLEHELKEKDIWQGKEYHD